MGATTADRKSSWGGAAPKKVSEKREEEEVFELRSGRRKEGRCGREEFPPLPPFSFRPSRFHEYCFHYGAAVKEGKVEDGGKTNLASPSLRLFRRREEKKGRSLPETFPSSLLSPLSNFPPLLFTATLPTPSRKRPSVFFHATMSGERGREGLPNLARQRRTRR